MTAKAAPVSVARRLDHVRYEIRGPLARRALEIERAGHEVVKLNIGNPAAFGFRTPEPLRRALIENLARAEGYVHQKGVLPAREAIAADAERRGIEGVSPDDVFLGNGVSELILMAMEALLDPGDEVLLPAPDYPLWTASVILAGAKPVHYPCREANAFVPDPGEVQSLVGPRTRALVLVNPNNPTGAVYPEAVVRALARIAEERQLVLFSDEIYDKILYDGAAHVPAARSCEGTLCGTFGGLSKVYRACGLRTGWLVFSGQKTPARRYIDALETLASLRLCANVPGQWAVPAALESGHGIHELTAPDGRLGRQRAAVLAGISASKHLSVVPPMGAMYALPGVQAGRLDGFDDGKFAMALLEHKRVLIVPGSGFNVDYTDHFRVTLLPDEDTLRDVFGRIEELLDDWARNGSPLR